MWVVAGFFALGYFLRKIVTILFIPIPISACRAYHVYLCRHHIFAIRKHPLLA